jgi:methyltransferase
MPVIATMQAEILLALVFVPMLAEARLASRNERTQRARGGIEPPGDVYRVMTVAYPAAFLLMTAEGAVRGGVPQMVFITGAAIFAAAKALKWWAIRSLGDAWTFRVIVVPGGQRVVSGPYRVVAHPNYVAVVGELAGAAIMAGAWIAGPLATLAFTGLIVTRVRVERAALDAILRPAGHSLRDS